MSEEFICPTCQNSPSWWAPCPTCGDAAARLAAAQCATCPPRPDDIAEAERRIFDEWYATAPVGARLAYWRIKAESGVVAKASWWLPGTFAPCLCPHQRDGESCCTGPAGNMCCHGCSEANGPGKLRLDVSYRQPFRRRLYGLSTFVPSEAMRLAEWMVANGRQRVRIEVARG